MSQLNKAAPELMPFSAEEWEQTSKAVREFVLSLVVRVQELEGKDAEPEIPPVVTKVTEYGLHTLTCPECGDQTRAALPAGVPQGAFAPHLQAMISLLSGCYHLSKRDTADVMADFFQADVSLRSVSALEHRTSKAISEPVEKARLIHALA